MVLVFAWLSWLLVISEWSWFSTLTAAQGPMFNFDFSHVCSEDPWVAWVGHSGPRLAIWIYFESSIMHGWPRFSREVTIFGGSSRNNEIVFSQSVKAGVIDDGWKILHSYCGAPGVPQGLLFDVCLLPCSILESGDPWVAPVGYGCGIRRLALDGQIPPRVIYMAPVAKTFAKSYRIWWLLKQRLVPFFAIGKDWCVEHGKKALPTHCRWLANMSGMSYRSSKNHVFGRPQKVGPTDRARCWVLLFCFCKISRALLECQEHLDWDLSLLQGFFAAPRGLEDGEMGEKLAKIGVLQMTYSNIGEVPPGV